MRIRAATNQDGSVLYEWRNDPDTRAMSRDHGPIERSTHDRWLARVLDDPGSLVLIAESDAAAVGTVRFDRIAPSSWEVSLNLNPSERGRGLAAAVLAGSIARFAELRGADHLVAEIRLDNLASRKTFERCGFAFRCSDGRSGRYELRIDR